MLTTIKRQPPPQFATQAEHERYYGYVVVKPLATSAADVLGHYHTRREAEQAARTTFWETPVEVLTRRALRQLSAAAPEEASEAPVP